MDPEIDEIIGVYLRAIILYSYIQSPIHTP